MANPRNNPPKFHPAFPWIPYHLIVNTEWPYDYAPGSEQDKEAHRKIDEHIERTKEAVRKGLQKCGISYNDNDMLVPPFEKLTAEQRNILTQELMIADGWVERDEIPNAQGQKLKNEDEDVKMSEEKLPATDGITKTAALDLQEEDEDVKMKE